MESKKFKCEPGDLLRIQLPPVVRGVTISAIEVTVTRVKESPKELVVFFLLKPFTRKRYELVLSHEEQKWELLMREKNIIKVIPIKKVSVLDGG